MVAIRVQGCNEIINKLRSAGVQTPGRPLWKKLGITGMKWVDENFKQEGSLLAEGKWKRLSRNTVAGRRKGSSRILQDTGTLKKSFTYKVVNGGALVGTESQIAVFHEEGTSGPYVITPKEKMALKFPMSGGYKTPKSIKLIGVKGHYAKRFQKTGGVAGKFRFAKKVWHPGLPKRRMLPHPGDKKIAEMLYNTTEQHLGQVLRKVGLK